MRIGGKRVHWSIGLVGGILGLLLLVQLAVFLFLQPLVGGAIRGSINYFTDGLYQLDYEKIRIHLFRQSITLEGVMLTYDSSRVNRSARLQQQKYYTGTVRHVNVKLREFDYFLSGRYLAIDSIDVNQTAVFVHRYPALLQPDSSDRAAPLQFNTFRLIKPYFDSVAVSLVSMKQITLGLIRHTEAAPPDSTVIHELGMRVVNATVDSVAAQQTHGWPQLEEAVLWMRDQTFTSADSLYHYHVDSVGVDPLRGQLLVRRLSVVPRWGRYEMGQQLGKLTTWMQWEVGQVEVEGIDFALLTDSLVVHAQNASVDQMDLVLFRDLRLPKGAPKARPLLPELLRLVDTPFKIDTLTVAQSSLRYEERRDLAEQAGHIVFADLFASFYHVTNQTQDTSLVLQADVRTRLMNEGQAELHFEFPLAAAHGEHRIRGKMHRMPLTALNPTLEPLAFASVKSGVANHLEFEMQLDKASATGDVRFQYEDLKISLLQEDTPDQKKGIKSWLANWLVLKNSNPVRNQALRPGPIQLAHDSTQSMVRYWWLALRSGLMVSVGVASPPDDTKSTAARTKRRSRVRSSR